MAEKREEENMNIDNICDKNDLTSIMNAITTFGDNGYDMSRLLLLVGMKNMLKNTAALCDREAELSGGARVLMAMLTREYLAKNDVECPRLNQRNVATLLSATPQTAGQVLNGLERDGYVVRTRDEHDKRSIFVELTEAGRERAMWVTKQQLDASKKITDCFTDDEIETLVTLVGKANDAYRAIVVNNDNSEQ